jgi:8-oxoguanine deaminase
MTTLLVKNASVLVTMDPSRREIAGGGLFIRDGFIEKTGSMSILPATADEILDLAGHIVLPRMPISSTGSRRSTRSGPA